MHGSHWLSYCVSRLLVTQVHMCLVTHFSGFRGSIIALIILKFS